MDDSFPHLPIQREEPVNEKRSRKNPFTFVPGDTRQHGQSLLNKLSIAKDRSASSVGGFDDRKLFRFTVNKGFNPDDIRKISSAIEFVSQEDETVVIGFASNSALDEFESRLSTMIQGGDVTNKQVIYALSSVDNWSQDDRKGWALKKIGFPDSDEFLLDVELWPLEDKPANRNREWEAFEDWLAQEGIEKRDQVKRPELTLYRVLCNIPQTELLLAHRDVRSLDLPPSFGLEHSLVFQDIQDIPSITNPGDSAPGVVVLDSGIASGHPLLGAAVGDSQSFLPGEEAQDENGHGTHVAGLALYGDFESCLRSRSFVPSLRLFSGKILDRNGENDTGFVENHIAEAVRYFVENYSCKVFNLSFGDANKPYLGGHLKGLSVTLDSLSRELGVLFVVSAGNYKHDENSPTGLQWRERYPDYLIDDAWRIIEPAPALNVLTVGSIAQHDQTYNSQRYPLDPAEVPVANPGQPSPFTRCGNSIDGAVKPELIEHGGNWAINTRAGVNTLLDRSNGLGVISSSHHFATTGRPFAVDNGTSMSAPQVAHLAASVLREHPLATSNFLRALLCVNAVMPEACQELIEQNKEFRRVCGYGQVSESALQRSLEFAVTLTASARIENKRHHFYEIPVPEEFVSSGRRGREIAVAIAYTPAVRSTRIKYRATRIDFRLVAAPDLEHVTTMFNKATDVGDYENIKELSNATIGQQARSKGTVQADFWKFKQFNSNSKLKNEKLFIVVTRNDFSWGESLCTTEENYSILVSLRDPSNQQARLYSNIKTTLDAKLTARQTARVRV